MPILWRYALQSYLRVFSLSVCAFIVVLIVARFKDLARLTALSSSLAKTGLFVVYHIPPILPIAIPISALLASLLLFQRLSRTLELTALRASGLSLGKILTPLLLCAVFLSMLNFSICADIAPFCRREGKALFYSETSQNPLVLLQRQNLVTLKHAYLDMKVKNDETIQDLILVSCNKNRLTLLSACELHTVNEELFGEDLALISHLDSGREFDHVIVENQSMMSTDAPLMSAALQKKQGVFDLNALSIKMLRFSKEARLAHIEILRRISLSMAVFSFTLLGAAFGIEEGRNPSKKNLLFGVFLTLFVLMSYLFGKGLKEAPHFATLTLLLPHPVVWLCSIFRLHQITRGRL